MKGIPYGAKMSDPLMHTKIEKDGCKGVVEEVNQIENTKENVYRVLESDGGLDFFTAHQVREFMERAQPTKSEAKAKAKPDVVKAVEQGNVGEDEDTEDVRGVALPKMKKPAVASKGKAKPAAQKSIAKNAAKTNCKAAPKRGVLKKPARQ